MRGKSRKEQGERSLGWKEKKRELKLKNIKYSPQEKEEATRNTIKCFKANIVDDFYYT